METAIFVSIVLCFLGSGGKVSCGTNLALHKYATQSSTAFGGNAGLAVDGNDDPVYGNGSCTHTAPGDHEPWWKVDLGETAVIETVLIRNRNTLGDRLKQVTLRIGYTTIHGQVFYQVCDTFEGPRKNGAVHTLKCWPPRRGRYVRIAKSSSDTALTLCEVVVLGRTFSTVDTYSVALKQPAYQSGTDMYTDAYMANDGLECYYGESMAEYTGSSSWWIVFLPFVFKIIEVYIMFPFQDYFPERIKISTGMGLPDDCDRYSAEPCFWDLELCADTEISVINGQFHQIPCDSPQFGSLVVLWKTNDKPLYLCEVKVVATSVPY